jgi:hypothetical protein
VRHPPQSNKLNAAQLQGQQAHAQARVPIFGSSMQLLLSLSAFMQHRSCAEARVCLCVCVCVLRGAQERQAAQQAAQAAAQAAQAAANAQTNAAQQAAANAPAAA